MGTGARQTLAVLAVMAFVLGFGNFFWLIGESARLGGDALNGYQRDAQCFVGSHGSYRQVDCGVWEANRIHGLSVFVTHPLAMLGMAYLLFGVVFPAVVGRQGRGQAAEREMLLRASGPELASGKPGGRIGILNMSGGLLDARVFPGGLLLKPVFMPPLAILKTEITDLRVSKALLGGQYVEITYASPGMTSPTLLYTSPTSDLARAIELMAGRPLSLG